MPRVVSLLPSATEALCLIPGAQALLVGRSHECDFPASIRPLPALSHPKIAAGVPSGEIDKQVKETLAAGQSLYTVDEAKLAELRPDVILTQDLCQVCSIDLQTVQRIARRLQPEPRVVSLNPTSLEAVLTDVLLIGDAIGLQAEAREAHDALQAQVDAVVTEIRALPTVQKPEVVYLEWMSPLFIGGHWTPQLIEMAGGRHSLNPPARHSVQKTPDEIVAAAPDFLIVCPCGYDIPATRRELQPLLLDQAWFQQLPAVRAGRAVVVDGNVMFNRPGPRLVDALRWLAGWLHGRPEWIPADFPAEPL